MSLATLAFAPRIAARPPYAQMPVDPTAPAPEPPAKPTPDNGNFDLLTRHIPTETITLYLAAMAAREQIARWLGLDEPQTVSLIYGTFAVLTPAILLVLMLAAHRQSGVSSRFRSRAWPLVAALAGFLVRTLSVPGHPAADQLAGLPALGALVVPTFLSHLDPLFAPRS
ncbi:MAG: hypothetical protein ACT6Q5_14260 [Sphingopyxis solisilvae]|uniref:hypothetical protein n=1 Tax=Sphingopyxis solisilvae TaxID=1886788 RepID=UPI0040351B7A